MASNPDAFLSALIGTTGLRPIQDVQQGQQQLQMGQQQVQATQLANAAAQQKVQRQEAFQQDTASYLAHPSIENLNALAVKYPEQHEALKQIYSSMDEQQRSSRQEQWGSLWAAANNGRGDLVAKQVQNIRDAEHNAGMDTTEADSILGQLGPADSTNTASGLARVKRAGSPDILRQIKGMAQIHLASIDPAKFSDTYAALNKGHEGYTMHQGDVRFDENNKQVASVAAKPDYLVVPEGGTAFPLNGAALQGGGDQSTAAPATGADIVSRMLPITLGSEGGGSLANPKTSPKGARGPMQVMPGTNSDPGFGVKAAQDESEGERARVGRDYLSAMMQRYGDPAKAWAAYNAGPGAVDRVVAANGPRWLSGLPDETRKYVARNMSQLQQSGPTGSSVTVAQSGPRVDANGVIHGTPKRGWVTMSPAEISASGLDPAVTYQRGPDGQIQPVSGQKQQYRTLTPQETASAGLAPDVKYQVGPDGKIEAVPGQRSAQLKPIPQAGVKAIVDNRSTVRQIDAAIQALQRRPKSIGPGTGMLGDTFTQYNDPDGTPTRAAVGKIGGQIIHDVSGAAVTLSEEPRFKPYVPLVTDRPEVALAKLAQLRSLAQATLGDLTDYYSEAQGYRSFEHQAARPVPAQPKRGQVVHGYRYIGGDTTERTSWVKAK